MSFVCSLIYSGSRGYQERRYFAESGILITLNPHWSDHSRSYYWQLKPRNIRAVASRAWVTCYDKPQCSMSASFGRLREKDLEPDHRQKCPFKFLYMYTSYLVYRGYMASLAVFKSSSLSSKGEHCSLESLPESFSTRHSQTPQLVFDLSNHTSVCPLVSLWWSHTNHLGFPLFVQCFLPNLSRIAFAFP